MISFLYYYNFFKYTKLQTIFMYRLLLSLYSFIVTSDIFFANSENTVQVEYTSQSNSTLLNDNISLASLNESVTVESLSESILNVKDNVVILELDNVTPVHPNTMSLDDMIMAAKYTNEHIVTQVGHLDPTLSHNVSTNEHTSLSPGIEMNRATNNKTSLQNMYTFQNYNPVGI